jgi:hypothetical protein
MFPLRCLTDCRCLVSPISISRVCFARSNLKGNSADDVEYAASLVADMPWIRVLDGKRCKQTNESYYQRKEKIKTDRVEQTRNAIEGIAREIRLEKSKGEAGDQKHIKAMLKEMKAYKKLIGEGDKKKPIDESEKKKLVGEGEKKKSTGEVKGDKKKSSEVSEKKKSTGDGEKKKKKSSDVGEKKKKSADKIEKKEVVEGKKKIKKPVVMKSEDDLTLIDPAPLKRKVVDAGALSSEAPAKIARVEVDAQREKSRVQKSTHTGELKVVEVAKTKKKAAVLNPEAMLGDSGNTTSGW